MMPKDILDKGVLHFQAEGRLLQELGLRLVASPEVALVELIKNAYDADSPSCAVRLEDDDETLVIQDSGLGMTLEDFANKWMRIATSSKLIADRSHKFRRKLTGAKGIGRFAVRYLGDQLVLESVAYDPSRKAKTRLMATFDWPELEDIEKLEDVNVSYRLLLAGIDAATGTTLRVSKLRSPIKFATSQALRDSVLKMVSPLDGLDGKDFARRIVRASEDPGFSVLLPGEVETENVNLAELLLDRHWARLQIVLKNNDLTFRVTPTTGGDPMQLKVRVNSLISRGFVADIRFFPRRKGIFSGAGVDGRKAWTWVRDNAGVAVIDHGFRIKPYGFVNDDWLKLDMDSAHNERDWRSELSRQQFPIEGLARSDPAANPMLNLPTNYQLVGAVWIETKRGTADSDEDEVDLIPAMDRQGLLDNAAAIQLADFIRAGIEYLAHVDKKELERLSSLEAKRIAKEARNEIKEAIKHIEASSTLRATDKVRIVKQYSDLADRLVKQEEYAEQSRQSLLTMSMLGVIAGFMTHESKTIVSDLEFALERIETLVVRDKTLRPVADDLRERFERFQGYLNYSRMFVGKVRDIELKAMSAPGQVRYVIGTMKRFADDRGIEILNEVSVDTRTPLLPVTVYSGIMLNLLTNALKAVIAVRASVTKPTVCFRGWNEGKKHIIEVSDNGVGIPAELRRRVWDPLYTTTSDVGNPLGSGMGLGLTLVKQVVHEYKGTIRLLDKAPPGYSTCFRVEFPLAKG